MSDHIIKALCNTLMHSLWQGIVLAVIAGAVVLFTRKSSASFRYNLLVTALLLFALGVTATFIWHLQKPAAIDTSYYPTGSPTGATQTTAAHAVSVAPAPAKEKVISYLNTHYNTIVLIWFLIICAKSVQLAVGLHSVSHLKRTNVSKAGEDWNTRLSHLAKRFNIQQAIRLMESGMAKVPMVVGHLKPVILIPIGLINSLPANEVEAILLHELAHIRRRDYLVNLLQNFLEIVFFFNPAVLWISQLIRTERENCCDDLTIAQSHNKESYIRAMVSCEEYQATGTAYAMAFPGAKNSLRYRVTRIIHNRNYSLSLFEKTILTICLVVTGIGISAFTHRENPKKSLPPVTSVIHHDARPEPAPPHPPKPDTSKKPIDTTHVISPGSKHGGSLAPPYENRHPGPYDTFLNLRSEQIAAELLKDNLVNDRNYFTWHLSRDEFLIDGVRQSEELRRQIIDKFFKPDDYFNLNYIFRQPGSYEEQKNYWPDAYRNPDGSYQSMGEERKRAQAELDKNLVTDLLQDGLITDPKNVSFTLNEKLVIINGKQQTDEVYRKYKEKYIPANAGSGWSWTYSHHE